MIPSLLFRALLSIAPAIPRGAVDALARATSRIEYRLAPRRRRAVLSNLAQVARWGHPALSDPRALRRAARSVFACHHRFLLEYLGQDGVDTRELDSRFRFRGMETLYRALEPGCGVILSIPHIGNWELAALALARLGFRVHVVTGVQFHPGATGAARARKERARILVSTPGEGFMPLLKTLRRGGIVALLTDGDVFARSLRAKFFGANVPFPIGPALLMRRAGAPLVHAHAERGARGDHVVSFDGVERADRALPLESDLRRITALLVAAQERVIAARVDQWCLFRPVFGDADAA